MGDAELRIGLIGCGGRGTGAASQALRAPGRTRLVAMGDAFSDRLEGSLNNLKKQDKLKDRIDVADDHKFTGFDAYQKVIDSDVDVVILATPPHFRPDQFAYAIEKGKHVFMEKPVGVDGAGIRKVLAADEIAQKKGLTVGVGLQRHHQANYRALMQRVHDGAIGDIVAARCYWNMGSLWHKKQKPEWSGTEWQVRNWLYFTWLSGDHITEQHVHNLDVVNWAKQAHPVKALGLGGRQVRVGKEFGHIFDHHAVEYEYADGSRMFSQCRQIAGCANRVSEHLIGTKGNADMGGGKAERVALVGEGQQPLPDRARRPVRRDSQRHPVQRSEVRRAQHADRDHGPHGDLHRQGDHLGAGSRFGAPRPVAIRHGCGHPGRRGPDAGPLSRPSRPRLGRSFQPGFA